MKQIGRVDNVWIALESTRNVANTTSGQWLTVTSFDTQFIDEYTQNTGSYGTIVDNTGSDIVRKHSETTLEFDFYDNLARFVGVMIYGSGTFTALGSGSGAYSGVFNLKDDNEHMTFTIGWSGKDSVWVSSGNVVNTLEISADITSNDFVKVNTNLMGYRYVSGQTLPSVTSSGYDSGMVKYRPADVSFKIASPSGALAASARDTRSVTVTFNKNATPDWSLGNISPRAFYNQVFDSSISVSTTFDSSLTDSNASGFYRWFASGTDVNTAIQMSNGRVISGSITSAFTLNFTKGNVIEYNRNRTLDDLVVEDMSVKNAYDRKSLGFGSIQSRQKQKL